MMEDFLTFVGGIALIIGIIFLTPLISFIFAYIGGLIAKATLGKALAFGLNTLFNVNYFTPDKIPLISATLGWLGGFFKSVSTISRSSK